MEHKKLTKSLRKKPNLLRKIKIWFFGKGVIIWTPGKVGTLSIAMSAEKSGIGSIHAHSLFSGLKGKYFINTTLSKGNAAIFSLYRKFILRLKVFIWQAVKPSSLIISGVRDPFSRSISAFVEQSYLLDLDLDGMSSESLINAFWKFHSINDYLNFFDEEWSKIGIDVYSEKFRDYSQGVCNSNKWFVFRVDRLRFLENEISLFIGTNFDGGEKVNNSSNYKPYVFLMDNIKWDKKSAQDILDSKFCRHFFNAKDRQSLLDRWS